MKYSAAVLMLCYLHYFQKLNFFKNRVDARIIRWYFHPKIINKFQCPSQDCLNFSHGNMQANFFFYKTWKIPGACMETFCRITMQPPLFELKLLTIPLLRHRDHFVLRRKFLK